MLTQVQKERANSPQVATDKNAGHQNLRGLSVIKERVDDVSTGFSTRKRDRESPHGFVRKPNTKIESAPFHAATQLKNISKMLGKGVAKTTDKKRKARGIPRRPSAAVSKAMGKLHDRSKAAAISSTSKESRESKDEVLRRIWGELKLHPEHVVG